MTDDLLLRKLQRQRKVDEFAAVAGSAAHLSLAGARMRGPEAVAALGMDTGAPADDRELAAWATGDLRDGLMALRRRPGCAAIAEGWLLLLKGETERARARFEAAQIEQPRRARTGLAVTLAALGRLDEAARTWSTVGPIPGAVFPKTGELTRTLTRAEAGWDAAGLRRLLTLGTAAEVETAARACPSDRIEERAWLALRLADLRWQTDHRDQRILVSWREAERFEALRPDVLKRRLWWKLDEPAADDERPGRITELAELHRLLARHDPAVARRCVEATTRELNWPQLLRLANPCIDDRLGVPTGAAPCEWILVWLRQAGPWLTHLSGSFGFMRLLIDRERIAPDPPRKLSVWRPWLRRLDQVYSSDATYLESKLDLLEYFEQHSELRLAAFQMLVAHPDRRDEFIRRWCGSALGDRRTKKTSVTELHRLWELFPGSFELALVHLELADGGSEAVQRLASAMPPVRAAVFRWLNGQGPAPELSSVGQDDEADLHLVVQASRKSGDPGTLLTDLINGHADRLHQLAALLATRHQWVLLCGLAERWVAVAKADWRGWYHQGKALAAVGSFGKATSAFDGALRRMEAHQPEVEELHRWLDRNGEGAPGGPSREHDHHYDGADDADAPPLPPQPRSGQVGPRHADGIRAAALSCGMGTALILSGLDAVVTSLDAGGQPSRLPPEQREQLFRFIGSMLPFLSPDRRPAMARILEDLV